MSTKYSVSVTQLAAIRDNFYKDRGSNSEFLTYKPWISLRTANAAKTNNQQKAMQHYKTQNQTIIIPLKFLFFYPSSS